MTTIRAQLQRRLALFLSALLVVVSAGLYLWIRSTLVSEFEAGLRKEVQALSGLIEFEEETHTMEFEATDAIRAAYGDSFAAGFLQISTSTGKTVWRSPTLGSMDLARDPGPAGAPSFFTLALPRGARGRGVCLKVIPRSDQVAPPPATVVLARDAASLEYRLDMVLALLALGTLVEIVGAVWIGRVVVARQMRPLQRVATDIQGISAESLSERLDPAPLAGELRPIVEKLNEFLGRLETSFERERRFSADLAHDLRTPVAGLRTLLEVTLERPRETEDYQATLRELLDIVLDTQGVLEKMLEVARSERGEIQPAWTTVVLQPALERAWKPFGVSARARDLEVQFALPGSLAVRTDPDLFRTVLSNLLANACAFADEGGTIRVEAAVDRTGVGLQIANPASHLTPGDLDHVFERFWRGEKARSTPGVHAGLGLNLVQNHVHILEGTVAVQLVNGCFTVVLHLPGAVDAARS